MDRFIDNHCYSLSVNLTDLKSNMDRFIVRLNKHLFT